MYLIKIYNDNQKIDDKRVYADVSDITVNRQDSLILW